MSLTTDTARIQYTVTTSPQNFAVPFYFIAQADIQVIKTVAGVDTTLILNTDYTVSGEGTNPSTGSVNAITSLVGATLTIVRATPATQPASYVPNDKFPSSTMERSLDRLTMLVQRLVVDVMRCLRLPSSNDAAGPLTKTVRSGKLLGFDSNGVPAFTSAQDIVDTAVAQAGAFAGGTVIEVATITALKAVVITAVPTNFHARALGYATAGDGGGGTFRFDSASSATVDGGTIFAPDAGAGRWKRVVGDYITPEMFGMVGDGATNDHPAWKKLVAYVNAAGAGTINFAPGKNYFMGEHVTAGNGITSAQFSGLTSLTINGNGATFSVQGGFNRGVDSTTPLPGIIVNDSKNVIIRNLTLLGGSDTITKTGGVSESSLGNGVAIASCSEVVLENLICERWTSDGINIAASSTVIPRLTSNGVTVRNCRCRYNARLGIGIIQAINMVVEGCEFSYSGQDVSYGGHSPQSGLDVEPDYSSAGVNIDFLTANITVTACKFTENVGTQFVCNPVRNMHIVNCQVLAGSSTNTPTISFDALGGSLRGNYIDASTTMVFESSAVGSDFEVSNNTLRAVGSIIVDTTDRHHRYTNNRIICTATGNADTSTRVNISNKYCYFAENYIFIPRAAFFDPGGGQGYSNLLSLLNCPARDTIYETDLLQADSPSGHAHFANHYDGGKPVLNEIYVGTAPGVLDTFRYVGNGTVRGDRAPFSMGNQSGGNRFSLHNHLFNIYLMMDLAAPTDGTWVAGDIVLNGAPAAGGKIGWCCTVAGTPGTWKAFGVIDA